MNENLRTSNLPKPAIWVDYDPDHPHPMFTEQQLAYIRKIDAYLSPDEIKIVNRLEQFSLDLKTGWVRCSEIPGLRSKPDEMVIYVERCSTAAFPRMIEQALDTIAGEPMGEEMYHRVVRPFRVSTKDDKRYYPIRFGWDFQRWRNRVREGVAALGIGSGEWRDGQFVLGSGEAIALSQLIIELPEGRHYPDNW